MILSKKKPALLRLRNLVSALERVLRTVKFQGLSSRIREVPDERTARFYTTLGILSPPERFDGRRALYGRRHLLELLAIKRLQSGGLGLREISERLKGAPQERLESLVAVEASVLRNAIHEAADDHTLDIWPRLTPPALTPASSDTGPADIHAASAPSNIPANSRIQRIPRQRRRPLAGPNVRTFRISDGAYIVIDPSVCHLNVIRLRDSVMKFAGGMG